MDRLTPATRFEQAPVLDMRFPPLPKTVAEVSVLIAEQGEVPDTPKLGDIIHSDPLMAATVLRRVNSAYYGMRRRITNIRKAVRLLGFLEVCHVVLTSSMLNLRDVLKTDEQSDIYDQVMRLSLGTAHFAQEVASFLNLPLQSTAFTAGLLHPVGRLVLLYNRPNDYEALWRTTDSGLPPTADAEELIFGTDHTKLGALAANHWNLPDAIVRVMRSYLTPGHLKEMDLRLLALSVHVSVAATEFYCLREDEAPQDDPFAAFMPSSADASPGPTTFTPPVTMRALARATGVTTEDLLDLLDEKAESARAYIEAMI